jgi:hypothetical protein
MWLVASAYKLYSSKVTFLDINNHDLPGLDSLLKRKWRLQKLWQEAQDPACTMAVRWLKKTIRKVSTRKAVEWWETKIGNCEVTPQAVWSVAKSLIKRGGPKAPTAILGPLGLKYQLLDKATMIADCLENQFTLHDLCGENINGG